MADGVLPEGSEAIGGRLAQVLLFLDASAGEMARRLEALLSGEGASAQEVARELGDLRKWAQLAYEERNRIEKLIRENEGRNDGGDGGHEIDFADARVQIGRRLDRLRAAAAAGEVSG